MGREPFYTAEQFINAIPGSGGIISTIAKRVGCRWSTAKKYIEQHTSVKQAYEDEKSVIDDVAESIVITAIKKGDVSTAKWWLAKKRAGEFGDNFGKGGADGIYAESDDDTKIIIFIPDNQRGGGKS